jgi:hypothetical protein
MILLPLTPTPEEDDMASSTRTPRSTRSTRTVKATVAAPAPEAPETQEPKENTAKSRERLEKACELIAKELASGEWVSSNELHRKLNKEIAEGMFGRAKKELKVQHRRVKPAAGGRAEYEWALPKK